MGKRKRLLALLTGDGSSVATCTYVCKVEGLPFEVRHAGRDRTIAGLLSAMRQCMQTRVWASARSSLGVTHHRQQIKLRNWLSAHTNRLVVQRNEPYVNGKPLANDMARFI